MSRTTLKALLVNSPNEFWDLVAVEGLNETLLSVVDEVEAESNGEGMLDNPLLGVCRIQKKHRRKHHDKPKRTSPSVFRASAAR